MFFTCCLTAIHLTASENEFSDGISQNANRYQIKAVTVGEYHNTTEIYVLDKEKGTIWMTRDRRSWGGGVLSYDPWIQLPPLPIQGSE